MRYEIDYTKLRAETGFSWSVSASASALLELADIPIRDYYLDPEAGIEAYRRGVPLLHKMFGPDVGPPGLTTPGISYGHANGLGSELTFPDGGEVGHRHIYESLAEGIEALKPPVDFAKAGMAPFYVAYRERMKEAFPNQDVAFGYGLEGPITTAYEVRGDGIFYDMMDQPEACRTFLGLLTRSILDFHAFRCSVTGGVVVSPEGGGMCDDIASMVPPRLFGELVMPFWEPYFAGMTTGRRAAHIEDLTADHLPFLEELGLVRFDPSISAKLNPSIIFERCRVPFGWRLGSFHYAGLTCAEIADFVFQAAADGASSVFTIVAQIMCNEATVEKVNVFKTACGTVARMLEQGATRADLGACVSDAGRARFWDHWPEL